VCDGFNLDCHDGRKLLALILFFRPALKTGPSHHSGGNLSPQSQPIARIAAPAKERAGPGYKIHQTPTCRLTPIVAGIVDPQAHTLDSILPLDRRPVAIVIRTLNTPYLHPAGISTSAGILHLPGSPPRKKTGRSITNTPNLNLPDCHPVAGADPLQKCADLQPPAGFSTLYRIATP
jgi:hypothetical protein